MIDLDDIERRVLGVLIEKELTVPDTYPLTLNALVAGCNQKNNRDPITDLEGSTIQRTLDALKAQGLVRFVHPSHGARSTKYRHVLHEHLHLDPGELALVGVLLLRGPQTLSELRSRSERAHRFESLDEVEVRLAALAARDEPVVEHLERRPGQKETRWMHLLGGEVDDTVPAAPPAAGEVHMRAADPATPTLEARVADLEARIVAVESVLDDLGVSASGND